jgi:GAF domain-containing protein/HAMP domain-containing protein
MAKAAYKLKPRFHSRLTRKISILFMALSLLPALAATGFLLLLSYLSLSTQGVSREALQPFLLTRGFQSLGVLAASLVLTGVIIAAFFRSLVSMLAKISDSLKTFAEGNWSERITIDRNDEVGLLAFNFNQMAEELASNHYGMEKKVQEKICDLQVYSEILRLASSEESMKGLLRGSTRLMVDNYGYHDVSVYLIDQSGQYLVLSESYGNQENPELQATIKFRIGSQTIIGWVGENRQPKSIGDVSESQSFKRYGLLIDTLSEAAAPITAAGHLLGVINVQSKKADKFGEDQLGSIQNLADLLGMSIHSLYLKECTEINIEESALLYNISQQVSEAESTGEILRAVEVGFLKTGYHSLILSATDHSLELVSIANPEMPEATKISNWPLIGLEEVQDLLPTGDPVIISDFSNPPKMPGLLLYMLREWQVKSSAVLPVIIEGRLAALLVLATKNKNTLSPPIIQPYANLAKLISTSIQKVQARQTAEKRRIEIRALQVIGEAVAGQTTMYDIYTAVHKAIQSLMGDVNFMIALYDQDTNLIQIPYMFEGSEVFNVDPFPLGEGLTSIVIRTRQPLLLVHDTERRTRELGAKIIGAPARSWLGVPMSLRGEVMGVLIVQDLEREGRFTEDDQQLLLTAGSQIGTAVQTARLLERTTRQADREKLLHEITAKIRRSTDMRTILATTASEIGKSLGAFRTSFEIFTEGHDHPEDDPSDPPMDIETRQVQNGVPDE